MNRRRFFTFLPGALAAAAVPVVAKVPSIEAGWVTYIDDDNQTQQLKELAHLYAQQAAIAARRSE